VTVERHLHATLPAADNGGVKWLALPLLFAVAACGAQADGDQWHRVSVRNDLALQVVVAGHALAPGETTAVTVNQNTGSGAYVVSDSAGVRLGCLPVAQDATIAVTAVPRCPTGSENGG
jgi:hypothetical protein